MKDLNKIYLFPFALIFLEIALFLSNDMYLPSMPSIAKDLNATQAQVQYTLTLWFLGSSSLQLFLGPISDRFGRRILVVLGAIVYVISSYFCAVAQTLPVLLIARFIQGSTICAVLVAGNASIHETFNTKMAIKIFAMINAVTVLAPAFGPLFGAMIIQFASWRYIFWLLTLLGIIGLVLILLFMPESNKEPHPIHIKKIFSDYYKLVTNKNYMLPNVAYCFLLCITFVWMFEAPFLMIETYGVSNVYYGVSQTLIFGCFFIGAQITRWIINKHNLKVLINLSMVITIFGSVLFSVIAKVADDMNLSVVALMIISAGSSMLFAPLNRIAVEASKVPMGCRIAISSTLIGLSGAISGWAISLIEIHRLTTISMVVVILVSATIVTLINTNVPLFFTEED